MWYIFVKHIVIPKFEPSDFDFNIHIIDSNTMNFLLENFRHWNWTPMVLNFFKESICEFDVGNR